MGIESWERPSEKYECRPVAIDRKLEQYNTPDLKYQSKRGVLVLWYQITTPQEVF